MVQLPNSFPPRRSTSLANTRKSPLATSARARGDSWPTASTTSFSGSSRSAACALSSGQVGYFFRPAESGFAQDTRSSRAPSPSGTQYLEWSRGSLRSPRQFAKTSLPVRNSAGLTIARRSVLRHRPAVRVPPKKADDLGKNPFIDVFVHR